VQQLEAASSLASEVTPQVRAPSSAAAWPRAAAPSSVSLPLVWGVPLALPAATCRCLALARATWPGLQCCSSGAYEQGRRGRL
jgi:hypothetical protein